MGTLASKAEIGIWV